MWYTCSAMTQLEDFWGWVENELVARGLNYHRVERSQGLSNAVLSRPARNNADPSLTVCKALAQAFALPLTEILVRAGHVEPDAANDGSEQRLIRIWQSLNADDRELALLFLERLQRIRPARRVRTHVTPPAEAT